MRESREERAALVALVKLKVAHEEELKARLLVQPYTEPFSMSKWIDNNLSLAVFLGGPMLAMVTFVITHSIFS